MNNSGTTVVATTMAGTGSEDFAAFPDEEFVNSHQATFRFAPFNGDR